MQQRHSGASLEVATCSLSPSLLPILRRSPPPSEHLAVIPWTCPAAEEPATTLSSHSPITSPPLFAAHTNTSGMSLIACHSQCVPSASKRSAHQPPHQTACAERSPSTSLAGSPCTPPSLQDMPHHSPQCTQAPHTSSTSSRASRQ